MSDHEFPATFATDLSSALKDVHRALIRSETGDDPALQNSPYTVLFALIGDPRFEWMGVLSQLITRLDELIVHPEESEAGAFAGIVRDAESLIGEGGGASQFRMHHVMALQKDPGVGLATGKLRKILASQPANPG